MSIMGTEFSEGEEKLRSLMDMDVGIGWTMGQRLKMVVRYCIQLHDRMMQRLTDGISKFEHGSFGGTLVSSLHLRVTCCGFGHYIRIEH